MKDYTMMTQEDVKLIQGLSDYRESVRAEIKRLKAELKTLKNSDLAEKFDISPATVSDIINRERTH